MLAQTQASVFYDGFEQGLAPGKWSKRSNVQVNQAQPCAGSQCVYVKGGDFTGGGAWIPSQPSFSLTNAVVKWRFRDIRLQRATGGRGGFVDIELGEKIVGGTS